MQCCHLSLSTSTPNTDSSVISVRCGVIVSVCWWDAWYNNYLTSPSNLVPKGKVDNRSGKYWQFISSSLILSVLSCKEHEYSSQYRGISYAFIILSTSSDKVLYIAYTSTLKLDVEPQKNRLRGESFYLLGESGMQSLRLILWCQHFFPNSQH